MKKRTLGIVLALVMAMVLGTSAMAASSIQASGIITDADAWDESDVGWNLLITDLHKEDKWLVDDISDKDTMKEVLGDEYVDGLKVVDAVDISVVGDTSKIDWDLTAELEIAGIKEDSTFFMVHWTGDEWELVSIELGDGYITAEFDDLSPFAFISDGKDVGKDSPQTGHPMTTPVVIMVVAAAALLVVSRRGFVR